MTQNRARKIVIKDVFMLMGVGCVRFCKIDTFMMEVRHRSMVWEAGVFIGNGVYLFSTKPSLPQTKVAFPTSLPPTKVAFAMQCTKAHYACCLNANFGHITRVV